MSERRFRKPHSVFRTRFDRFRIKEELHPNAWAAACNLDRTKLLHYRSRERNMRVTTLARIVRGTSALLGRPVRASELADVGEDELLSTTDNFPTRADPRRRQFDTRLDRTMRDHNIVHDSLAAEAEMSRQLLLRYRTGRTAMRVASLARIVRALRRNGIDVRAADIADVGED